MRGRKAVLGALGCAALGFLLFWNQGCKGQLPPTSAMAVPTAIVTPSACVFLMQDCESIAGGNGVFSVASCGTISLSNLYTTQGTHSLRLTFPTGGSCNALNLGGFYPAAWGAVDSIIMDVTADASLVSGSYNQLQWVAQSGPSSKWWQTFTSLTNIVAGSQSITMKVNEAGAGLLPDDILSNLVLVWNTGGTGTGSLYLDNIRLLYKTSTCPAPIPDTCGLVNSFETMVDNGALSAFNGATNVTVGLSTLHATDGAHSLQVDMLTGGSSNFLAWASFAPAHWTDVTEVVTDLYVDPSLVTGSTYTQIELVAQCGSCSPPNYWSPITAYTAVTAGQQSVTFNVDWTKGTMLPTQPISTLVFVWNTNGTGAGSFYFDNLRLRNGGNCP